MTDIIDIREKLRDTHAEIELLRREIVRDPSNPWLPISLTSLESRQQQLENAFARAAAEHGEDVFSYRLVRERTPNFPISVLGATLTHFQSLLTILYDAITNGPKERGKVSHEITEQSALNFGYSFAGSLGMVFTVPSERLLIGDSNLDIAVNGMFEMMNAASPDEVAKYAHQYGIAAVRKMYAWANHHVAQGITTDIAWRRGDAVRREAKLGLDQAIVLCSMIEAASEVTTTPLSARGILVGGDVQTKKFHLKFSDETEMEGRLANDFVADSPLTLGKVYEVEITVYHKTEYAIDKENTWYELRRTSQIQNELDA